MLDPASALAAKEGAKATIKEGVKETAEATIKESAVKDSLSTIENTSLEALKAQNEINLKTINESLKNQVHPITDVPFVSKAIEINGITKEGVFPDFKEYRVFQTKLPDELLRAQDGVQFKYCNEQLNKAYEKGTLNIENFTEKQIKQLKDGYKPEGYTWHHNEIKGRMELVKTKVHDATAHTGGRNIWGGGTNAR